MTKSFNGVISEYWSTCVTRFQPGYTVPSYTPDQFMAQLQGEQKNWIKFDGTWAETDDAIADMIFSAYRAYAIWYGHVLQLPLPNNAIDEYVAWYKSVHPQGGQPA